MATTLFEFSHGNWNYPDTNPAGDESVDSAATTPINRMAIAFDDTTPEYVTTKPLQVPAQYASGALTAKIAYCMASATSGKVDFEVSVEAITDGDAVDIDNTTSFDTANAANETVPGTAGYPSILSVTLTNADSLAAGDMVTFKLERDADDGTNDTATGDCYVLSMAIEEA